MDWLIKGKKILVTGGTGSIGSEIVRQVLNYQPEVVRIFSRDEGKQFELQHELTEYQNVRYLVGDVRDKERLMRAMEDIDIVFHAAALKHVPACEYNPFEAVKTNVIGVQNVIEAALDHEVEKVIAISTDKVANPTNTMGATKLLSEKLIAAANFYKGTRKTIFSCVRFGNVIGSRGSVIPLFIDQVKKGGPVTVTEPNMTRFMLSIPQAVELVLKAAERAQGGETFILKMPVLRLLDLAKVIILEVASKYGWNESDIQIKTIGLRPGEKLDEELMTLEEATRALELKDMFIILPQIRAAEYYYPDAWQPEVVNYSSKSAEMLSEEQIRDLLYHTKSLHHRKSDR